MYDTLNRVALRSLEALRVGLDIDNHRSGEGAQRERVLGVRRRRAGEVNLELLPCPVAQAEREEHADMCCKLFSSAENEHPVLPEASL